MFTKMIIFSSTTIFISIIVVLIFYFVKKKSNKSTIAIENYYDKCQNCKFLTEYCFQSETVRMCSRIENEEEAIKATQNTDMCFDKEYV